MSGKFPGGFVTAGAPAGYSVAFDGTGDYLLITNNAALNVGSENFCIEAWFYASTVATQQPIISNAGTFGSDNTQIDIVSGNIRFASSATLWLTGGAVTVNSWNHVAVSRSGTTMSIFLNGVRQATATNSTNFANANNYSMNVGRTADGAALFTGYISNARIVKGSAVYDPTATTLNVPTQLFPITNTSLLTCQSPTIVDNSTNAFTITANGDAKVSNFTPFTGYTAGASGFKPALGAAAPGVWTLDEATTYQANRQWPIYDPNFNNTTLMLHGNLPPRTSTWVSDASFNNFSLSVLGDAKADSQTPFSKSLYPTSGSAYFDGTSDYVTAPSNAALTLSGDFTIEGWVYRSASGNFRFITIGDSFGSTGIEIYVSGTPTGNWAVASANANRIIGGTATRGAWTHLAVVRSGTTVTLYVNGTASGSTWGSSATFSGVSYLGAEYYNATLTADTAGYISNLRVVNGVAVYTGTFTAPTAPLSITQSSGTNISAITGSSTALLTFQNDQPTNNSAFVDASSNNYAITRNGTPTQGTLSPFTQTGWSNYITSPLSNYITTPATVPAFTGDFTIECWVLLNTLASTAIITSSQTSSWDLYLNSTGTVVYYTGGSIRITTTGTVPINQWTHIALVRSSGIAKIYINGVADAGTYNSSATIGSGSEFLYIGRDGGASAGFNGYISNYRLAVGVAVYNTNFTPPTQPLGATSGGQTPPTGTQTYLLTCQNNRFVDNSSTPKALTITGAVSVQPLSPFPPAVAYTPYNVGGSCYSNGSTDYLTAGTASNWTFLHNGLSDWTIEFDVYSSSTSAQNICGTTGGTAERGMYLMLNNTAVNEVEVGFNRGSAGSSAVFRSTANIQINQWNHVAVTFVSSTKTVSFYINGVASGSSSNTGFAYSTSAPSNTLNISALTSSGTPAFYLNGYLSNLRISNSIRTGLTSLPTAPYANDGNTSLLLNYTNAAIIDSSAKNVLQTVGNAAISTSQSKYGGSSISIASATSDYVVVPYRNASFPDITAGNGSFTVEAWIYISAFSSVNNVICGTRLNGSAGWEFRVNTNGTIQFYVTGGASVTSTNTVAIGAWYHVAAVRYSGTVYLYINGTGGGSGALTTATVTTNAMYIGNGNGANLGLNGFIDDLRITQGVARYLANFTPPTSQLQDQ